jgi:ribosome-associated translation inhibitor RaiA
MYLDAAGKHVIVFNSFNSAFDILERRANNYSDRPRFVMAQDILSKGLLLAFMNYDGR